MANEVTNIAILIGVSQYTTAADLPACTADVDQMRRLLAATKKYAEIRCLTRDTDSASLKEALRRFFAKYKAVAATASIGEALVYFSGHGVYHNDALLCCSDFDDKRPASTSISNAELDDLLRSVAPDVAVKVIDACQSGSPYIKDASAGFEKALNASRLNSLICMASSRQDQSSYATQHASAFTAHWIAAALDKPKGTVLYRDIQAALADAFVTNPDQNPFFVNQGSGLEVFAVVTDEMRQLAAERFQAQAAAAPSVDIEGLVAEQVRHLDQAYVSQSEATGAITKAIEELASVPLRDSLVSRFYKKGEVENGQLEDLPNALGVAEFAEEQGWSKKYFVKVLNERYQERVLKNPFRISTFLQPATEDDYAVVTRARPAKLESTQSLPVEVASILFDAKIHPSLVGFVLYIGIVHSLTEVMVLSAIVQLTQSGWDERSFELSEIKWRYKNYPWRQVVTQPSLIWKDAFERTQEAIRSYLEALALSKEESPDQSNNDEDTPPESD